MRLPRIVPVAALAAALCLPLTACGGKGGTATSASVPGSGSGSGSTEIDLSTAKPTASLSPQEAQAVSSYKTYVRAQAQDSIAKAKELVAAVKAGDVAKAKSLYAVSRIGWESIEPVAEAFGDIDPKVDLREADLEAGQTWTGWHVIEKALWKDNTTEGMSAVGDQLVTDLETLPGLLDSPDLNIDAGSMAAGAKELLDEIAVGKITGEEEAFSHTDLVDFKANLDGAKKVVELLRPIIAVTNSALLATIDAEFSDVETALAKFKSGDGYVSYDKVAQDQRKELSDVVNALAEPIAKLEAAVAGGDATSATSSTTPATSASPSATTP